MIGHRLRKKTGLNVRKGGQIKTWSEGELTWIEANINGTAGWHHQQLANTQAVDSITDQQASHYEHTMVWAWMDEAKGLIKSRTFLLDWGTLEDQGNGSGAMQLAIMLGRKIEIHQGKGSVIYAEPSEGNFAKVGGRVRIDAAVLN